VDLRRVLLVLVTVGIIVLVFVPAAVTFGLGWLQLPHIQPVGAPAAKDTTTIEGWTVFAVVYLAWIGGLTVLLVWSYDRIGYRWQPHERSTRPPRKQQRRTRATLRAVNAERQATNEALRRRAERDARRRRDREASGRSHGGR
jgi:hypothetical protein